jgi:hypothetical protein
VEEKPRRLDSLDASAQDALRHLLNRGTPMARIGRIVADQKAVRRNDQSPLVQTVLPFSYSSDQRESARSVQSAFPLELDCIRQTRRG